MGSLSDMLRAVAVEKMNREELSKPENKTSKSHKAIVHAGGHVPANPAQVEKLRAATIAGNWNYVFGYLNERYWGDPIGDTGNVIGGVPAIQLGKFHYVLKNGKPHFQPLSEQKILSFLRSRHYVGSESPHCNDDVFQDHARTYWQRQQAAMKRYAPTNWRHVVEIYPGQPLCWKPKPSALENVGKAAAVAVGAVAAVTLGPAVLSSIKSGIAGMAGVGGAGGTAAGGAASAGAAATVGKTAIAAGKAAKMAGAAKSVASSASLFSQIQTTGNALLGYYNKARTVEAIANGELPPPPISITGNSFTEWALQVAKKEIKDRAIEMGQEHLADKLYAEQEAALRADIQRMQRELAGMTRGVPKSPVPQVPAQIQQKSAELALQQKQLQDRLALAAILIPVGILIFKG